MKYMQVVKKNHNYRAINQLLRSQKEVTHSEQPQQQALWIKFLKVQWLIYASALLQTDYTSFLTFVCFFESAWTILSIFEFFKHSGVSGGPCFLSVISHIHFSSYKANEERPTASNIIHGEKCFSSHQNHLKQPTLGISRQQYSILFQE